MVNGVLYTTAGIAPRGGGARCRDRRNAVDVPRGRGQARRAAPRKLSGRGLAYWTDGKEARIVYVTPGYQLIALDAKTGGRVPGFGKTGIVDLKLENDQAVDLDTGEIGLHAAPIIARDVDRHRRRAPAGGAPKSRRNEKGYIRGYDARTGKRLWIFHTIPLRRRVRRRHLGERVVRRTPATPACGRR